MTVVAATGIYTIADAGRFTWTPQKTVRRWVELGISGAHPSHEVATGSHLLSFDDLISLLTVRELRRAKVDLEVIKDAEANLANLWGVERPFAHGRIRTGYGAIVTALQVGERPVSVTKGIQEILIELIDHELSDVTFDANQQANLWQPHGYQHVALRPDLQWGLPCIEGTRITTRTVWQFIAGGESFDELSEDLEVSVDKLRAAYRYEESIAKPSN